MNYIKIVEGVAGLIPKKVKVVLINANSNEKLGEYKVSEDKLPAIFDKPTVLEIGGKAWRIIRVHILRESSYLFSRKIEIFVESPDLFDPGGRFLIPTKSFSEFTIKKNISGELTGLRLEAEDWRQLEFLPVHQLDLIQQELSYVEAILNPSSGLDRLLGYDAIHTRKDVFDVNLSIPAEAFSSLLPVEKTGAVEVTGHGTVENSFVFQTDWYSYYGICIDGIIKELAIVFFDCMDDEFASVLNTFGLVLVDWCNARVVLETPPGTEQEAAGF